jgi:DNA repair protein RadC
MTTLYVRDASGFREADAADVLARARAILSQRFRTGSPALTPPALTREYLRMRLAGCDREIFGAIFLDVRHRVIAVEDLCQTGLARKALGWGVVGFAVCLLTYCWLIWQSFRVSKE